MKNANLQYTLLTMGKKTGTLPQPVELSPKLFLMKSFNECLMRVREVYKLDCLKVKGFIWNSNLIGLTKKQGQFRLTQSNTAKKKLQLSIDSHNKMVAEDYQVQFGDLMEHQSRRATEESELAIQKLEVEKDFLVKELDNFFKNMMSDYQKIIKMDWVADFDCDKLKLKFSKDQLLKAVKNKEILRLNSVRSSFMNQLTAEASKADFLHRFLKHEGWTMPLVSIK